ncbi:hypothetical protein [Streptomyces sp. KS_5]|nr:hypothetical protein [Streptomyces sp. KS_5]SEC58164.1 hypothetical protein SAMN05428938_2414 [Streptomyces sp. KS_5]
MKRILASSGAAAADGCSGNAGQRKGPGGGTYTARYCHNYQASDVGVGNTRTGHLYAGDNWFVCRQKFDLENPPVGSARNNWWLWAQGDVAYADTGWGWFPATKVSGGNNWESIPGLQSC